MSFAGAETATVSIGEVAAMSDAELTQFMQKHRLSNGDYDFPVNGWERLPKDERSYLAEMLETRLETEAYHELINNGGRPLYPIGLIPDVYRDPHNYAEMLWPWQEYLTSVSPSDIFQRQLQSWREFRSGKAIIAVQDYPPRPRAERLAEIEADPSCLKSGWDVQQSLHERQRRLYREHGCRGLTTWTEYLNYEYWSLDKYTSDIERLELEHDKLWQELVDEKVLRPHETKEFVRTIASPMERANEMERAQKIVKREESKAKRIYVLTQKDLRRLNIPQAKRISMLNHGAKKLLAAKRWLEQIRNRNHRITQFIKATFDYDEAKRDAARRRILVQWVLDQVSLIDAEVNPPKASWPKSNRKQGTKRRLITEEEPPKRQSPKRVRLDLRELEMATIRPPSKVTKTRPGPGMTMDHEAVQDLQPKIPASSGLHLDNA
ncbi:ankyrin 2,3/unc44 [Fusarium austroafricanum]|uniref:Ankyrin 2,3/unc44 n=1 Tax=Fusarium austroafricanum TaxID=2364996 RepID=A0A8H4NED4_9HYPO|nr:ankyrin 2,3/unc44 [Fusarium austroafricanum]